MGTADRLARIGMAILFSVLYIFTPVEGIWTVLLLFIGGLMIGSAAIGFCPMYALMGIDTCKVDKKK